MLKDKITEDMKAAMRAGEKQVRGVVLMAMASIKQLEVDGQNTL